MTCAVCVNSPAARQEQCPDKGKRNAHDGWSREHGDLYHPVPGELPNILATLESGASKLKVGQQPGNTRSTQVC